MNTYVVHVQSLHHSYRRNITKRVELRAPSLIEACRQAEQAHPNLGLTPTTTSACWLVWPQPRGEVT